MIVTMETWPDIADAVLEATEFRKVSSPRNQRRNQVSELEVSIARNTACRF